MKTQQIEDNKTPESDNQCNETREVTQRETRAYWRQNTYEGHPHSYTLVNGGQIQDFPTYSKLCDYCRKNNIVAQLG